MVKQEIFEINGEKVVFCQAETVEEAEKAGFPKGIYNCWIKGKERIFSPGIVVQMIQNGVLQGNFRAADIINKTEDYYREIVRVQRENCISTLKEFKKNTIEGNAPKEAIDHIDRMIQQYEKMPFPGIDGSFRPSSLKQAQELSGNTLNEFYDPDVAEKLFK